jgi:spore maturation protein CgeB
MSAVVERAPRPLRIVFFGCSITASSESGHAAIYRTLLSALAERGHRILFLQRDLHAAKVLPQPLFCQVARYHAVDDLEAFFTPVVRDADVVVVGSAVPDGVAVAAWVLGTARGVTAYYHLDAPERADLGTLAARFALCLSTTVGPAARRVHACAQPLPRAIDPALYRPTPAATQRWDLGFLGIDAHDHARGLDRLLVEPARRWREGRFAVAAAPDASVWPRNVERLAPIAPAEHRTFYNAQRFTLDLTRADSGAVGRAPSSRLFEAAACGVPIISDAWPGLESLFTPGREILLSGSAEETLLLLRALPERERRAVGDRARERVLAEHTAAHRARAFERYVQSLAGARSLRAGERQHAWTGSS